MESGIDGGLLMKRIVHVVGSLGLGGAERLVVDLVLNADRRRFETHVLCLFEATGPFADRLRENGIPVSVLGLNRSVRPGGWLRTARALRALRPDVVHAHLPEACWYALPAAWLLRTPVRVAHIQNVHWHWPPTMRRFDRAMGRFATTTLACSQAARRFRVDELGYRPDDIAVVPNAVDLAAFRRPLDRSAARAELGVSPDALVLVCVASLTEQKGHSFLLDAFRLVRDECPEAQLLLVGDGVLRPALERQAKDEGIAAISFLGRRSDVPTILAASDLFVLASVWEGLGTVLIEAGAAALPIVATNVDGIPEVVEDGITGLLVPPRAPEALAQRIITLLRDPKRRGAMGRAAGERVGDRFSVQSVTRAVEDVYEGSAAL